MLLIMSQLLLLPTKQPRYCRQPGQRIKTKHKTECSSSGRFFSHPSMAKRTLEYLLSMVSWREKDEKYVINNMNTNI